jgi:hypothetical protein
VATFKKKYEVIKTTTKDVGGVELGGRKMPFGKSGAFTVSDSAQAKDIDQLFGKSSRKSGKLDDVVVVETDNTMVESGHRYTFSTLGMPWAKYDELGKRIPDEGEQDANQNDETDDPEAESDGRESPTNPNAHSTAS